MARRSRRSSQTQAADSSPKPPPSRSRKRVIKEDSEKDKDREEEEEEQEQDQDDKEETVQPRRRKQSRTSEDGSGGGGGGSSSSGGGGGGGAGSGSGSGRRSSGFHNIASQGNEDEDGGDELYFNESQGVARSNMVKTARRASKEVEIEAKDMKKANEISVEERQELVKKMARFLLMKGLNHEPVIKKEMMDVVLGPSYRGKGVLKYVLTKADEQLRDGVGFRVKNVAAGNDWFVKDAYYVINVLNNTEHSREILKGRGRAGRGLLMLILSIIHCNSDKVVGEDQLFKKLHDSIDKRIPDKPWQNNNPKTKIKVHVDGLGELHEHLAAFVKQHYLMKKTLTKPTADGGSESIPAYAMGARSVLEVGSRQLAELMAQVMGTTVDPSEMVDLEGESQGLSQMATQDN
eukprot:g10729.t1